MSPAEIQALVNACSFAYLKCSTEDELDSYRVIAGELSLEFYRHPTLIECIIYSRDCIIIGAELDRFKRQVRFSPHLGIPFHLILN